MAASLAHQSRHPAARVIAAAHPDRSGNALTNVTSHPGLGVSASIAGRELRLGRSDFAVAGKPISRDYDDAVLLADDTGPIAAFRLSERLRVDAGAAIDALKKQGVTVLIASGDSSAKVASIAERLGVSAWRARQLPAEKLAWLASLRADGARVLAVGDGVNDAPVLAGADVAIALAEGAELAQASSDIVLTGGRLDAIAPARAIAQQTLAIVRQNQQWALFYNFAAVPLAALGLVPPWLAALGMSLSSLGVILNTLRIGRGIARERDSEVLRNTPARYPTYEGRVTILLLMIPLSLLFVAAPWCSSSGRSITISSTTWRRQGCCRSTTCQSAKQSRNERRADARRRIAARPRRERSLPGHVRRHHGRTWDGGGKRFCTGGRGRRFWSATSWAASARIRWRA